MKTPFLALTLVTLCSASTAFSQGAAVIIKQRAKESAGRPLNLPAPPAPSAPGAPATAVGPAQPNVSKILVDLATIKARPQVTAEQKEKLAANLGAVALGVTKPGTENLQTLANAIADAIAGKRISSADQSALARDLAGALNAAGGSPQFKAALQGVQDALVLAGVDDAAIQVVAKALLGLSAKAK